MASSLPSRPSLETLIESGDWGLEILHPGGLEITLELARLCGIGRRSRVLDVACGSGESACHLAHRLGARVTGLDASPFLLDKARKKAARLRLPVELVEGDAHRLPFEDEAFDAAICECSVCLLDKARAVGEMARVVRPGGCVGLHDVSWTRPPPARVAARLLEIEGERPETPEGWREVLLLAGLEDVEALDRSAVLPAWTRDIRRKLGWRGQLRIFLAVLRRWGVRGLRDVLESEAIFRSRWMGYTMIVGRKPLARPA